METKILKINPENPEKNKLQQASQILKNGGLVAFPTETVYGLGANGLNKNSSDKVYQAKKRPSDNPLIFHISNQNQLTNLVENINQNAQKLIEKFWPGPLTIIFEKNKNLNSELTFGMETIAIRMPENKIAKQLIELTNLPIVAPSANLSGKPSPTKAEHVFQDLNRRIDMIIDGGQVQIGLESTVIDCSTQIPTILRHGKILEKEILKTLNIKKIEQKAKSSKPKAPGMKYKHYSPNAKIYIYENNEELEKLKQQNQNKKITIKEYENQTQMAQSLFNDFRQADNENYKIILIKSVKEQDFGLAIMDRLKKAAENKKEL